VSSNARLRFAAVLIDQLLRLVRSEDFALAGVVVVSLAEQIDLMLAEARSATPTAVVHESQALYEARLRLEAAEAAGAASFERLWAQTKTAEFPTTH
jgi:hypothetical protein